MPEVKTLLSDYLVHFAKQTSDVEALVFGDERLSYAELNQRVTRYAKALMAAGIVKGDRVATLSTPSSDYWVMFLATVSIGGIWLGLNPKYKLPEFRFIVEDAKPKALFTIAKFEQVNFEDIVITLFNDYEFLQSVVSLREHIDPAQKLEAFLNSGASVSDELLLQRRAELAAMDPALLVYTSGSTGKPKGALLSHYGLCFGATIQNKHYAIHQPRMLCSFPINHVACVADTCCINLVAGGTLIFQERFSPGAVLQLVAQEKVTVLLAVPTMLLLLLEHADFAATDFGSIELIAWGGAALPVQNIERLKTIAPRLMNVYGLTESAANVTYTRINADMTELSETIGRPDDETPCRIINAQGQLCAVGEEGELQFKGDYLLLEYLNRPEATRDVYTADGWLHTGDLGYWREEGTITLVGRMSDMFKSGGYNVYPREIENHLETHPAVEMAAVVGVPDERFQEVGAAYVILNDDQQKLATDHFTEALKTYCAVHLANYKIPKSIAIVTTLPTLPVGKVDKVALKQQACEQLQKERV